MRSQLGSHWQKRLSPNNNTINHPQCRLLRPNMSRIYAFNFKSHQDNEPTICVPALSSSTNIFVNLQLTLLFQSLLHYDHCSGPRHMSVSVENPTMRRANCIVQICLGARRYIGSTMKWCAQLLGFATAYCVPACVQESQINSRVAHSGMA